MGGVTKNDFEWRFTFEKSALKVEFQKRLFGFPVGPAWRFNLELFCFLVCFCEALSCRTPRRKFQFSIVKIPFFRIFRKKKMLSLVSQITTLYQAPPPAKNAKNLLLHCSFSEKVISQAPRPSPAPALQGAEFQLNLRWIAEEFSKKVSKFSVCASLGVFARLSASLRVFAHLCAFCNSSFYCDSRQTSRFRSVQ